MTLNVKQYLYLFTSFIYLLKKWKFMQIRTIKYYLTLAACFVIMSSNAQNKDKKNALVLNSKVHVETVDGNDFVGILLAEDSLSIKLKTENLGEVTIKKVIIKNFDQIQKGELKNGEYWFENPNSSRYLFAPSAYNLRKGEGYYQNIWIFMNQVSYGFSDRFTCGIGLVPTFLFGGEAAQAMPLWITPKYSFGNQTTKFNFAVGALTFFLPFGGADASGTAGIVYGLGTYGSRDNNISVGLGWGFARSGGEGYFGNKPTINISGMYRFSKRSYFVTENWFAFFGDDDFGSNLSILSAAYRYAGKNISLDLGLFRPIFADEELGIVGLPWLGVTIPFGNRVKN